MRYADYKLAGDIPQVLRGRQEEKDGKTVLVPFTVKTPEAESDEEFLTFVENGDRAHMRRLAQGQLDIIRQRKIREYFESDEVAAILAGKVVGEGDEALDFGDTTEDDRIAECLARGQAVGDAYIYGTRTTTPGGGKTAAVERDKKVREAAKNDPELAAKLAELGISL